MSITLIESPPFVINFRDYDSNTKKDLSKLHKVQSICKEIIHCLGVLFKAIFQSTYLTLKNSPAAFKQQVIGHTFLRFSDTSFHLSLPPGDLDVVVLCLLEWLAGMGWCLITTTNRLFWEQFATKSPSALKGYANPEFNLEHFQTKDIALDVSGVPERIKLDDLKGIFKEINFTNAEAPGYIPSTILQENQKTNTPSQLESSLDTFINNVKKRVPFLGTPPSYDVEMLNAFYQQIENAVRLSIHKINQEMTSFKQANGEQTENYDARQKSHYEIILAKRARLAIDLAIAGKYCGARYMGDAMTIYYDFNDASMNLANTLEEDLIELLGEKRKEIALNHIQIHLGNDTHAFGKYMAHLGGMLAIPGTKHIIEHLDSKVDVDRLLNYFFQDYSVDFVISAIQNKIKTSQPFREKMIDWIRDQAGDWNRENYTALPELIDEIQQIISDKNLDDCQQVTGLKHFLDLMQHLKNLVVPLPSLTMGWDDFLIELFALDETKTWFAKSFHGLSTSELRSKRMEIQIACTEDSLDEELKTKLKELVTQESTDFDWTAHKFNEMNKIAMIRRHINIDKSILTRFLKNKSDLTAFINNHLNIERSQLFLEELHLEEITEKGLSEPMIEWLLVSQKILLPQVQA